MFSTQKRLEFFSEKFNSELPFVHLHISYLITVICKLKKLIYRYLNYCTPYIR